MSKRIWMGPIVVVVIMICLITFGIGQQVFVDKMNNVCKTNNCEYGRYNRTMGLLCYNKETLCIGDYCKEQEVPCKQIQWEKQLEKEE